MKRIAVALVGPVLAALLLGGCGSKDATLCDFYHSLSANYMQSQGYVPSKVQDSIDEYC